MSFALLRAFVALDKSQKSLAKSVSSSTKRKATNPQKNATKSVLLVLEIPCTIHHCKKQQEEKSWGVPKENSGRSRDKFGKIYRMTTCFHLQDFGHRERQTCPKTWVTLPETLSPPSMRGVFWNWKLQPSRVFLSNNRLTQFQRPSTRILVLLTSKAKNQTGTAPEPFVHEEL